MICWKNCSQKGCTSSSSFVGRTKVDLPPMQQRLPELTMEILILTFHHHHHGFIRSDWIWRPSSMKWRRITRPTVSSSGHRLGQKQLALLKKERLTVSQSVSDIMEKPCWITIYLYICIYIHIYVWKRRNHVHLEKDHQPFPLPSGNRSSAGEKGQGTNQWDMVYSGCVSKQHIQSHTQKLCLMGQLCLRIGFKSTIFSDKPISTYNITLKNHVSRTCNFRVPLAGQTYLGKLSPRDTSAAPKMSWGRAWSQTVPWLPNQPLKSLPTWRWDFSPIKDGDSRNMQIPHQ